MKELTLLQYLIIVNSILAAQYLTLFLLGGKWQWTCLVLSLFCVGIVLLSRYHIDEDGVNFELRGAFLSFMTGFLSGFVVYNVLYIRNGEIELESMQWLVVAFMFGLPVGIGLSLIPDLKNNLLG